MTVLASAPPAAAVEAAQAGVARVRSAGEVGRAAIPDHSRLSLAAPHQVFHLALADLARMRLSDDARAVSWRFIVVDESRALGAVEVRERNGADGYVFSQFNSGPFVAATVEALGRLEGLDHEPHDLRLLDIPALYVQALWLHGDVEQYMPLAPAPCELDPYRLYPAEEFASVLARLAASRRDGPALPP